MLHSSLSISSIQIYTAWHTESKASQRGQAWAEGLNVSRQEEQCLRQFLGMSGRLYTITTLLAAQGKPNLLTQIVNYCRARMWQVPGRAPRMSGLQTSVSLRRMQSAHRMQPLCGRPAQLGAGLPEPAWGCAVCDQARPSMWLATGARLTGCLSRGAVNSGRTSIWLSAHPAWRGTGPGSQVRG